MLDISSGKQFMRRALELARKGEGWVEPNPMVGCVLVKDGIIVGEGFHQRYGGHHAEVEALNAAGEAARDATCYVTLEPCNHHEKTPPCTNALINAGVKRVVLAMRDPNPVVSGQGIQRLERAGIEVREGVLINEAVQLNEPYITLLQKERPFVVAKWAMTLDGRIASRTGSSGWVSNEASRQIVHKLRGRMDAVMIGSRTAIQDDARLTVRRTALPSADKMDEQAPKVPLRVILDSKAAVSLDSRLLQTVKEAPILFVVGPDAPKEKMEAMKNAGCELLYLPQRIPSEDILRSRKRKRDLRTNDTVKKLPPEQTTAIEFAYQERIAMLMKHLAKRQITNLLVEGGSQVFGTLFDMQCIDEVHVFIAPKLIGGEDAVPVFAGLGLPEMEFAHRLNKPVVETVGQDIYIHGRLR